jgi:hypothetical protein
MSTPKTRRQQTAGALISVLLGLCAGLPLVAQQPSTVEGVVVDAESGEPIPGVEVRIEGMNLLTATDDTGAFRIEGIPRGSRRIVLRHLAYGEHERAIVLEEGDQLQFQIRMSREAIELSPITVEVASERDRIFAGGGNPANVIEAEAIAAADRTGTSLMSLLQQEVPGIRIRSANCVEYRFQGGGGAVGARAPDLPPEPEGLTCRELAVYMDGVRMQESASLLINMYLDQLERIEVLSPGQAGVRYGAAGAQGVILLETKQGLVPDFLPDRVTYTGFGWYDERPYRWPRVLGASLASNAAATALIFGTFIDCSQQDPAFEGPTTCSSAIAAVAGALTGVTSGLLTRWAGKSSLTEGRMFPLMAVGTASAMTSYLLLVRAQEREPDASHVARMALSAAGTSLLLTLADRIFRVGR